MTSALPALPIGSDVREQIVTGKFPALGTALQGLEILALPPWRVDTIGATAWQPVVRGNVISAWERTAQNLFARATNAFTVRIHGDQYAPVENEATYKRLKAIANSLEIRQGDDALFVFAFNSCDAAIRLGKIQWGTLVGVELGTEFLVSGAVRDTAHIPRLIELDGELREVGPDDEVAQALRDAKVWVDAWPR